MTTLDGYEMAKKGRAGAALTIAAVGSFLAGCVSTLLIALLLTPLSLLALTFTPPDYCALMVLGLTMTVIVSQGRVLPAAGMAVLGILMGLVGYDLETGIPRFTLGILELSDGLSIVALVMGMFGLTEILLSLEETRVVRAVKVGSLWHSRDEWKRAWKAILRGTALGSVLGIVPGGGALLSSFAAYALEKRIAKRPEEFGSGAVEGVAGPESANNAGAQTSLVPLLAFGIPGNVVMALMVGALMIQGIVPGPALWSRHQDLFWGFIVSMWFGNLMLLVLNVPLVGIWVKLLSVPYRLLFPFITLTLAFGAYSLSNSTFDGLVVAAFGLFGYACAKLKLEAVPFVLGFFLGPLLEENFRRTLNLSHGDLSVFLTTPISATLLSAAAIITFFVLRSRMR